MKATALKYFSKEAGKEVAKQAAKESAKQAGKGALKKGAAKSVKPQGAAPTTKKAVKFGDQGSAGPKAPLKEKKVEPYEVGKFKDLADRSKKDGLEIHHAPQRHPAKQRIQNYNEKDAPSMALPSRQHKKIPNVKGDYDGSARDLLAKDARNLRNYTNAPNGKIEELVNLTKEMYPENFVKGKM